MAESSRSTKVTHAGLQLLLGIVLVVVLVMCFEVLYVQLQRTGGVDSIAWQYRVMLFALWLAVGLIASLTVLARHWSPLVPATAGILLLLYVLLFFIVPIGWVDHLVFSRIPYQKAGTAITVLAGFYLFPAVTAIESRTSAVLATLHEKYPRWRVAVGLGVSAAIAIWLCFGIPVRFVVGAASVGRGTVFMMMGFEFLAGLFAGAIFHARILSPLAPAAAALLFLPTALDYVVWPAQLGDPIFSEWLPATAVVMLAILFAIAIILETQHATLARVLPLNSVANGS